MTTSENAAPEAEVPFDLDSINTTKLMGKAVDLELKHPATQKGVGIFIPIVGKDSEQFRSYLRDRVNDDLARDYENSRRGRDPGAPTVERTEENLITSLIVCIMAAGRGWYQLVPQVSKTGEKLEPKRKETITLGGQELAFSQPNVRRLVTELLFARRQLDDAVGDLELFIEA